MRAALRAHRDTERTVFCCDTFADQPPPPSPLRVALVRPLYLGMGWLTARLPLAAHRWLYGRLMRLQRSFPVDEEHVSDDTVSSFIFFLTHTHYLRPQAGARLGSSLAHGGSLLSEWGGSGRGERGKGAAPAARRSTHGAQVSPRVERGVHRAGDLSPSCVTFLIPRHPNSMYALHPPTCQVRFLPGFFSSTLPGAPFDQLALLRLDGDLYPSTRDALVHCYPKLAVGGFCIVDDYFSFNECRRAVDEYRDAHGVTDELVRIDRMSVMWRRGQ
eukprot:scaffold7684_cov119-Isochrysis_galbana.AAC.5